MNSIVINSCFGGFGLSPLAVQWLIDHGIDICPPSTWDGDWDDPVPECEFTFSSDMPRHHPVLVACVETLGGEANGESAELKVVEIPGNQYIVNDYDGREWVTTPEDIQWTTVDDRREQ